MSPFSDEAKVLVERVREALETMWPSKYNELNQPARAALTELAERLKAAEKALAGTQKTLYAEVGRTNAAEAQRDELVAALRAYEDESLADDEVRAKIRAALARVEGGEG